VIQRRAVVGLAVVATAALLAGCGFQSPAIEDTEHASVQATDYTFGTLRLGDTSITQSTSDGKLYLVVTIVNDGPTVDSLIAVSAPNATMTFGGTAPAGGPLALLPGVPVQIDQPSTTAPGPTISIATTPVPQPGTYLSVTFTFATAGAAPPIQVPIVPAGETTAATQPVATTPPSIPTQVGETTND
jgi:hypothetical protein